MDQQVELISVKIEPLDMEPGEECKGFSADEISYENYIKDELPDPLYQTGNGQPATANKRDCKKDSKQSQPSVKMDDKDFHNNLADETPSNHDQAMDAPYPVSLSFSTPTLSGLVGDNDKPNRIGCPSCTKVYHSRVNMMQHLNEIHGEDFFVECDQCYRTFKSDEDLRDHADTEHSPDGIPCDECGKTFLNKKKLGNHKFYTHAKPEESVSCEVCHKIFKKKYKLKVHVRQVHSADQAAECPQCSRVFKNDMLLQRHIKWNHPIEGTVYTCGECGKESLSMSCYKRHMDNVHSESKEMTCEMCQRVLASKKSLIRHMKSVHKDGKKYWKQMKIGNIPCAACDKKFTTNTALYWHMEQVHSDYYQPTKVCHICSKEFSEYYVLRRHLEMVHPIESATCRICNKTFKSEVNLESHMRITHAPPEAAKTCDVCKKTFKCAMHLRIHMSAVHPKEGDVVCDVCNRQFASRRYLNAHRKIHVEVRAFECNLCGNTFKRQVDVGKHIRKVHKKHECSICHVMFGSSLRLNEHFETEHRGDGKVSRCLKCDTSFTNDKDLGEHIAVCKSDEKEVPLLSVVKIEVEDPSDED